jgi:aminomethyltransferase
MDDTINPIEADLMFAVKLDKPKFVGLPALLTAGELKRKRIGLKITGKGIVREHQDVYVGDKKVGHSTSGTHCPYLGGSYAMAILDIAYTAIGTKVEVDVRGRRVAAEVVALPFYKRA